MNATCIWGWYCCWHTKQRSHYSLFSVYQYDWFLTRVRDVSHLVLLNDVGWQFEGRREKFTSSRWKYDLYCFQLSIIKSLCQLWFSSFKTQAHKVVEHQTHYHSKEHIPSKVDLQIMTVIITDNFNAFKGVYWVYRGLPLTYIIFWVLMKQEI